MLCAIKKCRSLFFRSLFFRTRGPIQNFFCLGRHTLTKRLCEVFLFLSSQKRIQFRQIFVLCTRYIHTSSNGRPHGVPRRGAKSLPRERSHHRDVLRFSRRGGLEVFALGKTKGNSKLLRQEIIQMISLFFRSSSITRASRVAEKASLKIERGCDRIKHYSCTTNTTRCFRAYSSLLLLKERE